MSTQNANLLVRTDATRKRKKQQKKRNTEEYCIILIYDGGPTLTLSEFAWGLRYLEITPHAVRLCDVLQAAD